MKITAPASGRIQEIYTLTGEAVVPGTLLLSIEAAKEEIEIRSSVRGVVQAIQTSAYRTVTAGDFLLDIRELAESSMEMLWSDEGK